MPQTRLYWIHCLSPTHIGTGRGVGYIDLPIHREAVTNWPAIPGSAFKGVWADHFRASAERRKSDPVLRLAFGVASDDAANESNSGALVPTDARIVCMPVRSFRGTFAWCTSQLALQFLQRDLWLAGVSPLPELPAPVPESEVHVCAGNVLTDVETASSTAAQSSLGRVYFEDLDFEVAEPRGAVSSWAELIAGWVFPGDAAWRLQFQKRFAVLPDVVFNHFAETGTEVVARVRIDDATKTVADGALWNEEALPAETILSGLISCDRVYARDTNGVTEESLLARFAGDPLTLQIGGKATVGRGRVRCQFTTVGGGAT
jgi:CRISPR-associated protein Cmr4